MAEDSLSNTNHNYADKQHLESDTANHHLRRALLFGFGEDEKSEEDSESPEAQEAAAEDEEQAAAKDETEEDNQSDNQAASETESENNDPKGDDNAEDGAEETAEEEDTNGETNDSTDNDAAAITESEDTAATEETAAAEGDEQDTQATNSADDAAAAGDETSTEGKEEEESTEASSKESEESKSDGDNESNGDTTANDETKDESDNSGGEDTTNQSEDKEPLPFLTDSDLECLDTTASFVASNKALKSAIELFENSQILKDEDNHPGIMVLGHSSDQVNAMRSACALRAKNGQTHWAFVEYQHLECVIEQMETIKMHVHNYGKCLAMIEPCVSMDPIHLIQKDLVELGYNCWPEDNDGDDNSGAGDSKSGSSAGGNEDNSSSSTSEAATSTTAASGDDQASENDGDAAKEEENSEPSTEENEDSSRNSNNNASANNQQCLDDTREMIRNISSLSDANDDYFNSKTVDLSGDNPTLTFDETKAKDFEKSCQQAQGISKTSFEIDLSCEMMKEEVTLEINNVAFCLANTKYCGSMDDIKAMTTLIQDAWTTMGLACATSTMDDDKNDSGNSGSSSSSSGSSSSANNGSEESALAKTLGLSDTDVACLDASTDFIDSDPDLKNATSVFMKSLNTSDPNRLGYPKAAVEQMHDVCGQYNGVYIGGATQDLICRNNKKQRCISTYNFGACVASTNECQSMNPFVMTKIFLWEVMNLKCSLAESSCEVYNKNNPNTNKNGGNHNSSGNLSSPHQQQQPNGLNSDSALPSLPMIVTGLAIVGALGFFGLKKYRAQRQVRQRRTQEAYEMTQISDLGFKVFT